jgi:hypothetical protein
MPTDILDVADQLENKDVRARAVQIKEKLTAMAESQLPSKMGRVYTNIVLSCMTCLDPDNSRFGDESNFTDEDGILVGVRYIEKVSQIISFLSIRLINFRSYTRLRNLCFSSTMVPPKSSA